MNNFSFKFEKKPHFLFFQDKEKPVLCIYTGIYQTFIIFKCVKLYFKLLCGIPLSVSVPAMIPLPPQDKEKDLKKEEEEKMKKAEEDSSQTLDQQENMAISGTNARHMVMQKLMRKTEVWAPPLSISFVYLYSLCQLLVETLCF